MYLQKINLKNKYALVTGAGKGLGRACSIALAEAGATVIALSRTQSDLNKLEKDISIFFFVFPAALCLYSVINSGVSLGQQRYLYKKHGVLGDTQAGAGG